MAISLDGWLAAASFLTVKILQIRCFNKMYVIHIFPPLQIVNTENECEDTSPIIYIPAKSKLTGSLDSSNQRYFFKSSMPNTRRSPAMACDMNYNLLLTQKKRNEE